MINYIFILAIIKEVKHYQNQELMLAILSQGTFYTPSLIRYIGMALKFLEIYLTLRISYHKNKKYVLYLNQYCS